MLIIRFGFLLTKCFSTKCCIKYSLFEWTTSSFERFNLSFLGKICANVLRMRIFMHKVKPVIHASEWFTGVYTTKLYLFYMQMFQNYDFFATYFFIIFKWIEIYFFHDGYFISDNFNRNGSFMYVRFYQQLWIILNAEYRVCVFHQYDVEIK